MNGNNMTYSKKIATCFIMILLSAMLISFAGCSKSAEDEPVQSRTDTVKSDKKENKKHQIEPTEELPQLAEEELSFAERVCGSYSFKYSDDEYDILQIVHFGNNLYAYAGEAVLYDENDSLDVYSFWAVEFIPDSEESVTDCRKDACDFNILNFSVMSNAGKYWGKPQRITLKIEEDGITWIDAGDESRGKHYIRDNRVLSAFPYMNDGSTKEYFTDSGIEGVWKQIDNAKDPYYLEFLPDGNIYIYRKNPANEVFLAGGSLTGGDGKTVCKYSVLGYGDMPDSFAYTTGMRGYLLQLTPDPSNDCSIDIFNSGSTVMFEKYRSYSKAGSIYKVPTITYDDIVEAGIDEDYVSEFDNFTEPDTWAGFYGVWVGASKDSDEAESIRSKLEDEGFDALTLLSSEWSEMNSKPFYCVSAGRCYTDTDAESLLSKVIDSGYKDAYVKYTGERLLNRVFYTLYSLDDVEVNDDMIVLRGVQITDSAMGSESEYTKDLYIDKKTGFDSSCNTDFFGNYEKGDTVYEWFKRNYEYSKNDPDKYMESGPALIGIFEISITDSHIDSYYGSYWWD